MRHLIVWLLLALLPAPLHAHSLGESYGVLRAGPGEQSFTITYNMRRDQFLQLADLRYYAHQSPLDIVGSVVKDRYQLFTPTGACEKTRFATTETETFLQASFVATCPGEGPVELRDNAFFELLPDHLHFVRVSSVDGGFVGERVLDRANRVWALPEAPSVALADVAARYARLGVGHMAFGFDHLAFLASILLLVGGVKPLVFAITGFTVGHSITLALAVLGLAVPNGQMVEALIGLTIALVAAESVFRRQSRLGVYAGAVFTGGAVIVLLGVFRSGPDPLTMVGITLFFGAYLLLTREHRAWMPGLTPLLTAFFGLIHGFGFAGSLLEIGLPGEQLAVALLAFNLGIELGQLLIVGALLLVLLLFARMIPAVKTLQIPASNVLAGALVTLGMFWFVDRGFA
ncbi:HupE/UreJ family protein [Congregibacter sp.]|uniref:HupE/UreJ family protein n=1 Tax=Congregibacter sp. TaxID=2744308 RepID=UPI003F6AA73C